MWFSVPGAAARRSSGGRAEETVRRMWRAGAAALLVSGSLVSPVVGANPASATTLQATVLPPVNGTMTSSPDEPHHRPYDGDYSFDVAGGGTAYAKFRNSSGNLALTVGQVTTACGSGNFADGGMRIQLVVSIDGARVGTVTYAHLTALNFTSGNVPVGAAIGRAVTTADGVRSSSCWTGTHVHVEPRNDRAYGCFFAGQLNRFVTDANPLGLIGGERAAGVNQACPSGAEDVGPP